MPAKGKPRPAQRPPAAKPSSLLDTRIIYCGDCLDQLRKLPDACVDPIYIDPPFNSNRNYEAFWGDMTEPRPSGSGKTDPRPPALDVAVGCQGSGSVKLASYGHRHASTQAYIDYMRPRCVDLARVLKKTGSFYYHCDWQARSSL